MFSPPACFQDRQTAILYTKKQKTIYLQELITMSKISKLGSDRLQEIYEFTEAGRLHKWQEDCILELGIPGDYEMNSQDSRDYASWPELSDTIKGFTYVCDIFMQRIDELIEAAEDIGINDLDDDSIAELEEIRDELESIGINVNDPDDDIAELEEIRDELESMQSSLNDLDDVYDSMDDYDDGEEFYDSDEYSDAYENAMDIAVVIKDDMLLGRRFGHLESLSSIVSEKVGREIARRQNLDYDDYYDDYRGR
jgi:hypothetical protein